MKKKWIKIFVTLLACATLLFGFTACADEGNNSSISYSTNAEQSSSDALDNSEENDSNSSSGDSHKHEYTTIVTAPTCMVQGFTTHTCACGDSYIDTYVGVLEHDFQNYVSNGDAKCEIDGTETAVCDRENCGKTDTRTQENSALGHDKVNHAAQAATCTAIGWAEYVTCERTGCNYSTYQEIPATGDHNWDNGKITIEPTCTATGVKTFMCTVCQTATYTDDVNALEHDKKTHEAQIPTCTQIGWNEYVTCEREGCNYSTYQEIPVIGHTYATTWSINATHHWKELICGCGTDPNYIEHTIDETGYCTGCETQVNPTVGIRYSISADGTHAQVIGYKGTSTRIKIAESYKGLRVTNIYNGAFEGKNIISVIIPDSVTSIGNYAFANCNSLTSITIPDCVTTIGDSAFVNCSGLTSVVIPDSVTEIGDSAFANCTSLQYTIKNGLKYLGNPNNLYVYLVEAETTTIGSVTIENNCKLIASYVFKDCDSLTSITIPASIINIGTGAFAAYVGYTRRVYYLGDVASWCNISFVDVTANPLFAGHNLTSQSNLYFNGTKVTTLSIPNTVTEINDYAFWYCSHLTSVEIPDTVTTIGESAFENCSNLTSVVIGNSVTSIGNRAFLSCDSLTSVVIGNSVTSIGESAFSGCSSLTNITIPDSVTSIGESALDWCGVLEEITLPFVGASADATGNQALLGYIFGTSSYAGGVETKQRTSSSSSITYYIPASLQSVTVTGGNILNGAFSNCNGLTSIEISDSVTSIGDYAFQGCSGLKTITIPSNVTNIGSSAFSDCTGLITMEFPAALTSIGSSAFSGCTGFVRFEIPNSVTSIAGSAFSGCSGLIQLTFEEDSQLTSISVNMLANCTNLIKLEIPDSVTNIGDGAFKGCSKLQYKTAGTLKYLGNTDNPYLCLAGTTSTDITSIVIENTCRIIYGGVFSSCANLKDIYVADVQSWLNFSGLVNIMRVGAAGKNLYVNNVLLTDLVIPNNITEINDYAFYDCDSLKSVAFEENSLITSIGALEFYGCNNLKSVILPDGVTSIGNSAFYKCVALNYITIPASVKQIGTDAFFSCYITRVNYMGDIASWCNIQFNNPYSNPLSTNGYTNDGDFCIDNERITDLIIPDTVTKIKNYAFYGCDSFTSIVIPNSVISVGEEAFRNCYRVQEITLPFAGASADATGHQSVFGYIFGYKTESSSDMISGVTYQYSDSSSRYYHYYIPTSLKELTITGNTVGEQAFYNCDSLTNIVVGENVTSIGGSAFSNCDSLTSIVVGENVTSVGSSAFYKCSKLTGVYITDIEDWFNISFMNTYANPLYYARNLYVNNELVTELVIPDTVTGIKDYAFYGCSSLTAIEIPESITSIGYQVFDGCKLQYTIKDDLKYLGNQDNLYLCLIAPTSQLIDITIDENCNVIASKAFYGNRSLLTVTFGKNSKLGYIGSAAFSNCTSLLDIEIPNSVISIGDSAFSNCNRLMTVTFGENSKLGYLGDAAFSGCTSLLDIKIPKAVTSIGQSTFYYCNSLTSIEIPERVTSIGDYAFASCSSLTNITIPDSVTSIGHSVFRNCSSLEEITLPFVGASIDATDHQSVFGYIFGYTTSSSSSTISGATYQWHGSSSYSYYHYYIPASLKKVTITGGEISEYAFYNCSILTSAIIGDGVTSIGREAFYNCSSLKNIIIPNSITSIGLNAFYNTAYYDNESNWENYALYIGKSLIKVKTGLSGEYTIKNDTVCIEALAFENCSRLTSITIPDSVTHIGVSAFSGCYNLETVKYIGDISDWCAIEFSTSLANPMYYADEVYINDTLIAGELTIPNSVTNIGNCAFSGYINLTSVIIPNSVTCIGDYAFYNCRSLTSIIIPDRVTSIGDYAFYGCINLTSVIIGNSVTSIGSCAFADCYKLAEVVNKSPSITVTKGDSSNGYIGYYALAVYNNGDTFTETKISNDNGYIVYADGIERILIGYFGDETVLILPSYITTIHKYAFYLCDGLTNVVIGNSVTSIGNYAFYGCTSLTSITIPDSVTSIGSYAFGSCRNLIELDIPRYLTSIGSGAFSYCSALKSITLFDCVENIDSSAFNYCTSLTSIIIPESVTSIGRNAFSNCTSLTGITFEDTSTWYRTRNSTDWLNKTGGGAISVTDASSNAHTKFYDYYLYKL